ncbi:MAG: hypothetical protein RLZZ416_324 [Candidatus Parcubacteria bacterium]|jgi:DNA polymerase III delta subunit
MLHLYIGSDRARARESMSVDLKKNAPRASVVRISDANMPADLAAALSGGGLFGGETAVVLDGIISNAEMADMFFDALERVSNAKEHFFMFEEKLDAPTRKRIEAKADDVQKFEAPRKKEGDDFFKIAHALLDESKKTRWVALQRALEGGKPSEAVHGILFWRAKDIFMKARDEKTRKRGAKLIALLAELPHASRRRGEELEYALERFLLSVA